MESTLKVCEQALDQLKTENSCLRDLNNKVQGSLSCYEKIDCNKYDRLRQQTSRERIQTQHSFDKHMCRTPNPDPRQMHLSLSQMKQSDRGLVSEPPMSSRRSHHVVTMLKKATQHGSERT